MSQIVNAEEFKADAEQAAEKGLKPEICLKKYEPDLHATWKRIYYCHKQKLDDIERRHDRVFSDGMEYALREYA